MTDNKTEQASETEEKTKISERLKQLFDAYIFPGKLFPCYRPRVGEDGEKLPPPTLDELLRFEADNAKGTDPFWKSPILNPNIDPVDCESNIIFSRR